MGGEFRYAGSVPIVGCDSFELRYSPSSRSLEDEASAETVEVQNDEVEPSPPVTSWGAVLLRFRRNLDEHRRKWRRDLLRLLVEKGSSDKKNVTMQVSQLIQAAKAAGLVSFELAPGSGGKVYVKIPQGGR